jgi:hypothetical protein
MSANNVVVWISGLLRVMISSAAGGVVAGIVDPSKFNFDSGAKNLAIVCGVLALTHGAAYLEKSPLPDPDPTPPVNPAK